MGSGDSIVIFFSLVSDLLINTEKTVNIFLNEVRSAFFVFKNLTTQQINLQTHAMRIRNKTMQNCHWPPSSSQACIFSTHWVMHAQRWCTKSIILPCTSNQMQGEINVSADYMCCNIALLSSMTLAK